MTDHRHVLTERLELTAVGRADTDELYRLNSDARVWTHFPSGRHRAREQTAHQVETFFGAWQRDGLGYWTARVRAGGQFIGIGGCMVNRGIAWNLYYRLRPEAQGNGYAAEMVAAARAAAAATRPELPVTAYLLEHNGASRRTAERGGLHLVWRGPDAGNPDPEAVRLIFADRALSPPVLDSLVAHA
jgi:RimJ/RimL family protein N-acetyltransferase